MASFPISRWRSIALPASSTPTTHGQVLLYLWLAFISGAVLPMQANLNAQLVRSLSAFTDHPLQAVPLAADISYLVGLLALLGLLCIRQLGRPSWSGLLHTPLWSLMGGIFGAGYIASTAYFTSVLGTTLTLGLIVSGQAIAGIIIDHFGWMGVPRRRLNPNRRLAIGLLIVAMFFLCLPT